MLGVHVSRNDAVFLTFMSWCGFPTLDSTINGLPICLFLQIIIISHIYKLAFWMVFFEIKIRVTKIRPSAEHKHTRLNLNTASRRNKVKQFGSSGTKHPFTLNSVQYRAAEEAALSANRCANWIKKQLNSQRCRKVWGNISVLLLYPLQLKSVRNGWERWSYRCKYLICGNANTWRIFYYKW